MTIFLMTVLGAILYRFRGAATPIKKFLPRPANQLLFAFPFSYLTYLTTGSLIVSLMILVLTTLATLTGHGSHMDLGTWTKPREDERLEFIIKWLKGKINEFSYDCIGLALNGFIICLPTILVLWWVGDYSGAVVLSLCGISKALAYIISWRILNDGTVGGEYLTGAFLWGGLAYVLNPYYIELLVNGNLYGWI